MPSFFRIHSDSEGQSHITEEPFEMAPFADTEGSHGNATAMLAVSGIVFRSNPPGYSLAWHCAPRRQYLIALGGLTEIETSDGTVACLKPGDVALVEDTTGKGHTTRAGGGQGRFYAVIPCA